jgi:ABC-type glutathione transport system ATPase component
VNVDLLHWLLLRRAIEALSLARNPLQQAGDWTSVEPWAKLSRTMFSLQNVQKRFGDLVAVAGIDLDVPVGTTLALIGASGSGKSTVLRLMLGLEQPQDAFHRLSDGQIGRIDTGA